MDKKLIERLDKFLAHAGITSRKNIKQLLKRDEVTVNGKRVTSSGVRVNTKTDEVKINGEIIKPETYVYYLLNKPPGVISTTAFNPERHNVVELIDATQKIYPVGRLDKETRGLILLTNDGELTHKLIHPKYHIPKVYRLIVSGKVSSEQIKAFRNGVMLTDGITLPAIANVTKQNKETSIIEVTLHEGRNRQIRRMCEAVGLELLDLQRIKFGPLTLGALKEGEYRVLLKEEVIKLKQAVNPA